MAKFGGHRRLLEDAPVPRWWEEDDRRGDDEIAMVLSITPMLTLLSKAGFRLGILWENWDFGIG